jgi:hypothetical protein
MPCLLGYDYDGSEEWGYHQKEEERKKKRKKRKRVFGFDSERVGVLGERGAPGLVAECLVMPFERFLQK